MKEEENRAGCMEIEQNSSESDHSPQMQHDKDSHDDPGPNRLHALATREGVEMPIVATVHRILFDGHPARLAVIDLMSRELRAEQDA